MAQSASSADACKFLSSDETSLAATETNTPVSVTIPMEGSKHLPDDGLSTTKRDEDLPTIQEECPSCGNDMAYVCSLAEKEMCSLTTANVAQKLSMFVCLQILSNYAAAICRRRANHLLHVYDLWVEVEAGFVAARWCALCNPTPPHIRVDIDTVMRGCCSQHHMRRCPLFGSDGPAGQLASWVIPPDVVTASRS